MIENNTIEFTAQTLDRAPARRRPATPRRIIDQYQAPSQRHASRGIIDELVGIFTTMLN